MRELIIDRLEGNFYICEDKEKKMFAIDKSDMVKGAKEGDVIVISDSGEIILDAEKTAARRKAIGKLQNSVFEN